MRPAPKKSCVLCQYSASNQFGELRCLFLLERVMQRNFTIDNEECPLLETDVTPQLSAAKRFVSDNKGLPDSAH